LVEEDSLDADLLYLTAGAFARVLLPRLDEPDREVDAAFALIERLHLEGDTYVTELATIGFLESIQQPEVGTSRRRPRVLSTWVGCEIGLDSETPVVPTRITVKD
jgi:hypothetical protein